MALGAVIPAMAYLDWNATTPLRAEARAAWLAAYEQHWGNPGSVHAAGQAARYAWDGEMRQLAELLGCRPHELVATSGGSEGLALALHSALVQAGGGMVLAAATDHSAVLRNAERHPLAGLQLLPVDGWGRLRMTEFEAALAEGPAVVCLQAANNETGVLSEVTGLVDRIRAACSTTIVVDACQLIGKAAVRPGSWGADYVALAGHKFGAPKGTGLVLVRTGVPVHPLISGGRQQDDRRSGTLDLAGLAALRAALAVAEGDRAEECQRQRALLDETFASIASELPAVCWIAREAPRLPNTLSLGHPGVEARALVTRLDLAGHAVSVGSACMAREDRPSHVIAALGLPDELRRSVIRVSIGWQTTAADLAAFAAAYGAAVRDMIAG